jgi:osmotically-inducible protein OsmY
MSCNTWFACRIVLLVAILAAGGCRTTQSPRTQVDDAAVTTRVKAKLATDLNLASTTNIDVNTTNGVVTLAGQVEDEQARHRAVDIARSVEGVVSVNDNLQVEASGLR